MKKRALVAITAAAVALIGVVVGCQTYDFEPVQPLAVAQTTQSYQTIGRSLRPNMMLLVDKSGSMNFAVDYTNPNCPANCGQTGGPGPCPSNCPTRITDLKTAMGGFLSTSGPVARMGWAFFPTPSPGQFCVPTQAIQSAIPNTDDPAALQTNANNILNGINALVPSGGTPTGASLQFVGNDPGLTSTDRDNFVLLLTDGVPNCNDANPNNYNVNPTTCRCTDPNTSTCMAEPVKLCLDKDGTVAAVTALKNKNIKTIVVGFGADTASGDGPEVLQAMALAGGFPRQCKGGTNAECGTGTCDTTTKQCNPAFYQAANANDLAAVLKNIGGILSQQPCDYGLAVTPTRPELITVLVNGQVVARGPDTWQYNAPTATYTHGEVQLIGALCDRAKTATLTDPVAVEIRFLQTFQ